MAELTLLQKVKIELRVVTDAFDDQIQSLIDSAKLDLGIAGVEQQDGQFDALMYRAVATYCKLHFGQPENPEMLLKLYEIQKGQLMTATGYTEW